MTGTMKWESSDWGAIRASQEDMAREIAEQEQAMQEEAAIATALAISLRPVPYEFCGMPDKPECQRTGRCMRTERTGYCCAD